MTNTEIALALQRWSHDPQFGERAQTALTRAARRILIPPERVLNFWDLPTLESWLARKHVRGPAAATPAPLISLNL